jgi:hypothetical protein
VYICLKSQYFASRKPVELFILRTFITPVEVDGVAKYIRLPTNGSGKGMDDMPEKR